MKATGRQNRDSGLRRKASRAMGSAIVGVGMLAAALPGVGGATPASAATPAPFRVLQLNMCMWGAKYYVANGKDGSSTCFKDKFVGKSPGGTLWYHSGYSQTETHVAAVKRQDIINVIVRYKPEAITVNEACKGDIAAVVKALNGYDYRAYEVGRGKNTHARACSVGRGDAVNAIIARNFVAGSVQAGYFEAYSGNVYSHTRSWICAAVQPSGRPKARVCTAHFALPKPAAAAALQASECRTMQKKLAAGNRTYPTIFAGDTNSFYVKCALNKGLYALRDVEWKVKDRSPSSGFQHIYYLNAFTRSSCGELHKITHTDHPGFLLDLHRTSKPASGKDCGVRQIL